MLDLQRTLRTVLDEDLGAAVVELRVTRGSIVKGKDLGTDEVVASRETSREVNRKKTTVGSESVCTPLVLLDVVAILPDLEPTVTSSRVRVHIVNLLHVDGAGALVAFGNGTRLGVAGGFTELEGQLSAAGSRAGELDWLVTIFT
ncbi:hypothetical protein LB506_006531 [Fusarium annulatum]|nr:hypothetical protein LB506_006531 [Fusarium annulatum]